MVWHAWFGGGEGREIRLRFALGDGQRRAPPAHTPRTSTPSVTVVSRFLFVASLVSCLSCISCLLCDQFCFCLDSVLSLSCLVCVFLCLSVCLSLCPCLCLSVSVCTSVRACLCLCVLARSFTCVQVFGCSTCKRKESEMLGYVHLQQPVTLRVI